MQAVEFDAELNPEGSLSVPQTVAASVPRNRKVRVIVLIPDAPDDGEDATWASMTAGEFLAGYAPGDAIYDQE